MYIVYRSASLFLLLVEGFELQWPTARQVSLSNGGVLLQPLLDIYQGNIAFHLGIVWD